MTEFESVNNVTIQPIDIKRHNKQRNVHVIFFNSLSFKQFHKCSYEENLYCLSDLLRRIVSRLYRNRKDLE